MKGKIMSFKTVLLDNRLYTREYFLSEDICRFCWAKDASRSLASTLNENNTENTKQLTYKIQDCLSIDISLESSVILPQKLCENCFSKIEDFFDYKCFCQDNERKLLEILTNYDEEPPAQHLEVTNDLKSEQIEGYLELESNSLSSFLDNFQSIPSPLLDHQPPVENKLTYRKPKRGKYKPKRSSTYCNICCKDYLDVKAFRNHNAEAHGIEINGEFKCFGCEKRFKSRKTRLGHEINFCKGLANGYKCKLCDRFLPKRRLYEAHMRDHKNNILIELGDDLFKCKRCDQRFKTKELLVKHMKEHEGDKKRYICETCGRVFARQDYLQKHTLTHTGVKRHACPQCDFSTAQRSSLTVHIRKHTGERPYECDICLQRCVSSSNLRAHRRRHLGLAAFQCTICQKSFGYKISLEEHIASVHERSQTFSCTQCTATYTRIRGLRRHLLAKHGIQLKKLNQKDDNQVLYVVANENKQSVYPNAEGAKEQVICQNENKSESVNMFLNLNVKDDQIVLYQSSDG